MNLDTATSPRPPVPQFCTSCGDMAVVKYGRAHLCGDCFLDRSEALLARFRRIRSLEVRDDEKH